MNVDIFRMLAQAVDDKTNVIDAIRTFLWENPETLFKEYKSSEYIAKVLENAGFQVEKPVHGLETAFTAKFLSGNADAIKIGYLIEYDALPGMFQHAVTHKNPEKSDTAGHGCQHALLGAGAATAAIALKEIVETQKLNADIYAFGTPAEEGGGGKLYFADAGAFNDFDLILTWHPYEVTRAWIESSVAAISGSLEFFGRSSHAAATPWDGRSALDSLLLFIQSLEFMREHVPTTARLHYVIDDGGKASNIVPDYAKLSFKVREATMEQALALIEDMKILAKAADMMSWRTWHGNKSKGYRAPVLKADIGFWEFNPNKSASHKIQEILNKIGATKFNADDNNLAREIQKNSGIEELGMSEIITSIVPEPPIFLASTDVCDVSWVAPTAQLWGATVPLGISLHSWAATASTMMPFAIKGTVTAAKALAMTGLEAILNETFRQEIKLEFVESIKHKKWEKIMNRQYIID
ncbi:MAG: amidohydrolase [Planctomycetes bacterium]|nr:amidohydrolase [Planctomycetota bacterium]